MKALAIVICLSLPLTSVGVKADTIIGASSLAAECYAASQAAVINGSSSRADLEICNRAILDGSLTTTNLIGSYVNRGVIYTAMKRPNLALKDLNSALALNEDTGEAYVNRGNLWFSAGDLEKAIKDYDFAIKLGVRKPQVAYLNRGIARESLGYLSAAQRDYKAALLIRKEWPEAQMRLNRVNQSIQEEIRKRESKNSKRSR